MSYEVKLQQFEGPLDLLLHLIRKNEVDIYDIPISQITDQYLAYVVQMRDLNLEVAGEFLLMAATLIHLKSKMLLPQPPLPEEESEPEDPRQELVDRLLEYQKYKEASVNLEEEEERFAHQFSSQIQAVSTEPPLLDPEVALFQLLSAFFDLLQRTASDSSLVIDREELDIHRAMVEILDRMEEKRSLTLEGIFGTRHSKLHMISLFLALLELIRRGYLKVRQQERWGEIWIHHSG